MKIFFTLFIFLSVVSLHAEDTPKWFLLEGVSNPDYKVYLDIANMDYVPGVYIGVKLKYVYTNDAEISYGINEIKFLIPENAYETISETNYLRDSTVQNVEPYLKVKHFAPGSEMSIVYQQVYIEAVSNYRPKSKD